MMRLNGKPLVKILATLVDKEKEFNKKVESLCEQWERASDLGDKKEMARIDKEGEELDLQVENFMLEKMSAIMLTTQSQPDFHLN